VLQPGELRLELQFIADRTAGVSTGRRGTHHFGGKLTISLWFAQRRLVYIARASRAPARAKPPATTVAEVAPTSILNVTKGSRCDAYLRSERN